MWTLPTRCLHSAMFRAYFYYQVTVLLHLSSACSFGSHAQSECVLVLQKLCRYYTYGLVLVYWSKFCALVCLGLDTIWCTFRGIKLKIGYKGDIDINFILFIELMLRKEINGLTTKGHSVTSSLARISKFWINCMCGQPRVHCAPAPAPGYCYVPPVSTCKYAASFLLSLNHKNPTKTSIK